MVSVEHGYDSIAYEDLIITFDNKYVRFQGPNNTNIYLSRHNTQRPVLQHGKIWIAIISSTFILRINNIPNIGVTSAIINNLITIF